MLPNVLVSSEQMIGALLSRVCADFRDFVLDFVARQEGIQAFYYTHLRGIYALPSRGGGGDSAFGGRLGMSLSSLSPCLQRDLKSLHQETTTISCASRPQAHIYIDVFGTPRFPRFSKEQPPRSVSRELFKVPPALELL